MSTPSLQAFMQTLRQQIAEGEIAMVLDQLQSYLGDRSPQLRNEAILLTQRYNQLRRNARKDIVSQDSIQARQNRLTQNLLDFLDDITDKGTLTTAPAQSPELDASELTLPAEVTLERILGINNLKQMAWLEQGLTACRCVCRLLTPQGYGTGFLIAPDDRQPTCGHRLMTNHHVIPNEIAAAATMAEFNYQQDFNQQPLLAYRYRLDATHFYTNSDFDCTIVGLIPDAQKPALETWGHVTLNPHADPVPGEHVVIIQHPNGGLKQIALTANQVISRWNHRLHYTTDTMPGSSGAPVFNDRWETIAIHHAGGKLQVNAKGDKRFINEGILMSAVCQQMKDSLGTNICG